MAVSKIPAGYHTVNPYLSVKGAKEVVAFVEQAFDGEVQSRLVMPDGRLMNAEVRVGDSMVMVGEAKGDFARSGSIYLYVEDTDAVYRRAIEAGATSLMEPADMYYGDRNAGVEDVGGNWWWIATHIEDVDPEEIQRRAEAHEASQAG